MEIKYIFLLIIVIVVFYSMKSGFTIDLYNIAYDLGINYINLIKGFNLGTPAVMFDIDDTLLYVNDDNSLSPIRPMIKLLNYCRKNKFKILIITARDSRIYKETEAELKKHHINYDYLYLRESPKDDYQLFKSDIKKKFMDLYNLNIVMSIGDNQIDILGPYSGYAIKLPNKTDPRLFHVNSRNVLENVVP
jgi:predicted secreted acid phosphatase